MKKKHTLILLFMFVFAGVILLGYTPVRAWDKFCTEDELSQGTCIKIKNLDFETVYIVKAYIEEGIIVKPGSNWPIDDNLNGRTVFRYIGGVSQDYKDDLTSKPSAWSYIIFSLLDLPLSALPPGAQLPLDTVPDSCTTLLDPSRIAYKLNPSVNVKSDAIFEFHSPLGTGIDECGKAVVIWSKNCDGGTILTPRLGGAPFEEFRKFECGTDWTVEVEYNRCTGEPEHVKCNEFLVEEENITSTTYGYAEVPGHPVEALRFRSFPIENMGPGTPGVVVCTDSAPVFLRGEKAWWCDEAPE